MKIRKAIVWILCLLLLAGLAGCSAPVEQMTGNGNGAPNDYIVKEDSALDGENSSALPNNRKFIQTVTMKVETDNLDTVLQQVNNRIAQLGGYIENSNVQNGSAHRSAAITVRVPAKDVNAFLDKVGEITNIVSSQQKVEDITLNYVATESRMKALQAEETRLLELMAKAETLNDLLTVEKRLTEVRTELEEVTSALKVMENQVDFATIHLSITEVKEFTEVTEPESVWERIGKGFVKSLKNVGNFFVEVFVFGVVALPYLVLIAIIPIVILLIFKIKKK